MQLSCNLGTEVTESLHHKVFVLYDKARRQLYFGDRDMRQAKSPFALRAGEMDMKIVDGTVATGAAYRIFNRSGTIVYTMNQLLLMK